MRNLSIEKITLEVNGVQWVANTVQSGCLLSARTDVRAPELLGRFGARLETDYFSRERVAP